MECDVDGTGVLTWAELNNCLGGAEDEASEMYRAIF